MSETSDAQPLQPLIAALRHLPGVGVKTAQRMAFHLMQRDQAGARQLAHALVHALDTVVHCQRCHTFSHQPICPICSDSGRDTARLCVVETPADLAAMERTGAYQGCYFVLMGRISPMDGVGAADIGLTQLLERALDGQVQAVILATSLPPRARLPRTWWPSCSRRAACRSPAWRAVCPWAVSWSTWTWAPLPTRW